MDLKGIRDHFAAHVCAGELTRPLFEWQTGVQTCQEDALRPITMSVYVSRRFVHQVQSRQRELRTDPSQLFKALRNTRRGYCFESGQSWAGRDGIFDLDGGRFDNDMTRQLSAVVDDAEEMKTLRDGYPFLRREWRAVRVVAHPRSIRVRPVGLLVSHDDSVRIVQRLVLVAVGVMSI